MTGIVTRFESLGQDLRLRYAPSTDPLTYFLVALALAAIASLAYSRQARDQSGSDGGVAI